MDVVICGHQAAINPLRPQMTGAIPEEVIWKEVKGERRGEGR